MGSTSIKFTGDADDAIAALSRLERKFDDLENKMKRTKRPADNGDLDQWGASVDRVAMKYLSIGTIIQGVTSGLHAMTEANKALLDGTSQSGDKLPQAKLKLQIQGGLATDEMKAALPGIEKSLMATPATDLVGGIDLQKQLASSGFNKKDVSSGAAMKEVLNLMAATNSFGEGGNPAELVQVVSMLSKGAGSAEPGAKDIREIGSSIVALFEASDVQTHDFKQLAPKIAGLKAAGVTTKESLAAFSALSDIMGGGKADSSLSQFASRTETISGFPERAAELANLGLAPEDVAISKHGFLPVIDKLRKATQGMDENTVNVALAKIYGEDAGPGALALMGEGGNARLKDYVKRADDDTIMSRNVETFQKSRYARQERSKVANEFATMQLDETTGGYTWAEYDRDLDTVRKKDRIGKSAGFNAFTTIGEVTENMASQPARWMGMSPTQAGLGRDQDFAQRVEQPVLSAAVAQGIQMAVAQFAGAVEKNNQAIDANNQALKENTEATREGDQGKPRRNINRHGNVE